MRFRLFSTIGSLFLLLSLSAGTATALAETALQGRLVKAETKGHLVYYSGTVTVSGMVERRTNEESLELQGDQLCFYPAKASAKLIPRESDGRIAWFCFSSRKEAMKMLKVPTEKPKGACGYTLDATVVISDYVANLQEADVFDTARLVKVVSSQPPKPLPCEQ